MENACAVIIVAAGSSRRAGFDKLTAPLGGSTVLRCACDVFYQCPMVSEIVLVTHAERYRATIPDGSMTRIPVSCTEGGDERYQSVWNGLMALRTDAKLVAVHDGARPLVHSLQLIRCIEKAAETGAAASAYPVVDTLKRSKEGDQTTPEVVDRSNLWAMETPQIFNRDRLIAAYRAVIDRNIHVTDEVSALEAIGLSTSLVINRWPNPKITWPGDLEMAELLLPLSGRE